MKKTKRSLPESWLGDKGKIPDRVKCKCGLLVNWFWLDSDCKDLFPSRWMRHQCVCELIYWIADQLNRAIAQKDFILREIEDNPRTRKYAEYKIRLMEKVVDDLNGYQNDKQGLLNELTALKKQSDPNNAYLDKRMNLAAKHNGWRELFDCENEDKTRTLLSILYSDGSDKFLQDLELIKQTFGAVEVK